MMLKPNMKKEKTKFNKYIFKILINSFYKSYMIINSNFFLFIYIIINILYESNY